MTLVSNIKACAKNMAAKRARVAFSSDTIMDEIREVKELLDSVKMFTSQLSLSKIAEAIKMKEGRVDVDPAGLLAFDVWVRDDYVDFGCHTPRPESV